MKPMKLKSVLPLLVALAFGPDLALAAPVLGADLATFAVLGASTVTNTGATTLTGQLGVHPGSAITGQSTITINELPALTTGAVFVHEGDALALSAQNQLTAARTNLGLLGPGTLLGVDLVGLTLAPGVYTVPDGVSNLTGALTLDGLGNANAAWVFQMVDRLITSPNSVVNVINTGTGAGIYWNVASSATLDTDTAFEGNILALASITLNTNATIGCGRALADTAAVTMHTNTIGNVCAADTGGEGSKGFSGGLTVATGASGETPKFLPFAPVVGGTIPEPATLALSFIGLLGLAATRTRRRASPAI